MQKLTIEKITYKNFKGLKSFEIEPKGNDLSISGDNATGKTTIADGVFWLLFDKDSTGKTKFNLKPLDKNNNEIHKIDTEIEGIFNFAGKTITLKKRYHEKWTKKRGSATKDFTGHETDYFIDGVPESKTEFNKKISDIIDQNLFKLVTNPYEFNNIKWEDRRKILFDIHGDIPSDEEIIKSDKKLSKLVAILDTSSIEDHKKKIKSKQTEINKEIGFVPARIDENALSIKDLEPVDEKEKKRLEISLDENENALAKLKSNEALSSKRVELNKIDSKIIQLVNDHATNKPDLAGPIRNEIAELESDKRSIKICISDVQGVISQCNKRKKITKDAMVNLRTKFSAEDEREQSAKTQCPACDQDLPEDEIESAIEKFNEQKAEVLKKITVEGKSLGKNLKAIKESIKEDLVKEGKLKEQLSDKESQIETKEKELKAIAVDDSMPDTSALDRKKEILESEISALENGSKTQEHAAMVKIIAIKNVLSSIETLEAEHKAKKTAIDRIAELEEQEKVLAKEYEALESELFLIEKFIVKKVEMLEGQINNKFKLARFKLFKTQINQGIDECCETLYNGVQFNHGLNSGARINVGLDIIRTLSEHYGFSAPIFVDNKESVTDLIDIDAQVITLSVVKGKKLTVKNVA